MISHSSTVNVLVWFITYIHEKENNLDNLEWRIKHENESTSLDFKREQYHKENYISLIKDIMAMANAPISGSRYIVIGIKHKSDGTKEYHPVSELKDQADIENLIQDNIEPTIKFQYFPLILDDVQLAIIKIEEPMDPPYFMKKDYKGILRAGDAYIRKGSKQSRMTRRDLDELLSFRSRNKFNGKIIIGFGTSLTTETIFKVSIWDSVELPSSKKRKEYQEKLRELEENLAFQQIQDEEIHSSEDKEHLSFRDLAIKVGKIGFTFNSNIRGNSILVGNDSIGFPLYWDKETLEDRIKNIEHTYAEEDNYFIKENCSEKLNFSIYNDGDSFLEDVNIIFYFPKEHCFVVEDMPTKPVSSGLHNLYLPNIHSISRYPNVSEENDFYIVEDHIENVRHKQLNPIFTEDLRILFKPIKEKESFDVKYEVHARNLSSPLKGTLKINLAHTVEDG